MSYTDSHYDPNKSHVSQEMMEQWLNAPVDDKVALSSSIFNVLQKKWLLFFLWPPYPQINQVHAPGVGEHSVAALTTHNMSSAFQLIGKLLTFRTKVWIYLLLFPILCITHFLYSLVHQGGSAAEACEHFYQWLHDVGVSSQGGTRHKITRSIAEKVSVRQTINVTVHVMSKLTLTFLSYL